MIRQWTADGGPVPYDIGPSSLFVAHYSSAEWVAHLTLGWLVPVHVIDTYAEVRALRNGLPDGKAGLLMAAARYGIATISKAAKDAGRELAQRGGPWSEEEQTRLLITARVTFVPTSSSLAACCRKSWSQSSAYSTPCYEAATWSQLLA